MGKDVLVIKKRRQGDDGYKTFSIRIREEQVTRLDDLSRKSGHSRNELISRFIDFGISHCKIE